MSELENWRGQMQACLITLLCFRRGSVLEGVGFYIEGRAYGALTPWIPAITRKSGVPTDLVDLILWPQTGGPPHSPLPPKSWLDLNLASKQSLDPQLDTLHPLHTPKTDKSKALNYLNETISVLIYFKAFSVPSVSIPLSVT